MKDMVMCIKNAQTKKGFKFIKGRSYDWNVKNGAIVVYFSRFEFVKIKNQKTFDKFFK